VNFYKKFEKIINYISIYDLIRMKQMHLITYSDNSITRIYCDICDICNIEKEANKLLTNHNIYYKVNHTILSTNLDAKFVEQIKTNRINNVEYE
jgi:hypothetical protein